MATQVNSYQGQTGKQRDNQLLQTAAPIAGSVFAGPIGGMAAGFAAKQVTKEDPMPGQVEATTGNSQGIIDSAVSRRQKQLQDINALDEAYASASSDPKLKKEFGPMLLNARDRAMYGA